MIPRTLAQNCGANIIRLLTSLRAKHAQGETHWGVNGESGELTDMRQLAIWEPLAVKLQVFKTAVEVRDKPAIKLRLINRLSWLQAEDTVPRP